MDEDPRKWNWLIWDNEWKYIDIEVNYARSSTARWYYRMTPAYELRDGRHRWTAVDSRVGEHVYFPCPGAMFKAMSDSKKTGRTLRWPY
jgi:hypothetical protein